MKNRDQAVIVIMLVLFGALAHQHKPRQAALDLEQYAPGTPPPSPVTPSVPTRVTLSVPAEDPAIRWLRKDVERSRREEAAAVRTSTQAPVGAFSLTCWGDGGERSQGYHALVKCYRLDTRTGEVTDAR